MKSVDHTLILPPFGLYTLAISFSPSTGLETA